MPATKFADPFVTAKGETRAHVTLNALKTLWVNTGTQCNLSCENCYIESSPTNDRLTYFKAEDLQGYLNEISSQNLKTEEIGFTGGEPFLNPHIIALLEMSLKQGLKTIVLTNAYRIFNRHKSDLLQLSQTYGNQLLVRVSLDHYSQEIHEQERGVGTFLPTLKNIQWLSETGISFAVAGRSLTGEDSGECQKKYKTLFAEHKISLDCSDSEKFVVFAEMSPSDETPEITTACWDILGVKPDDIMCSSSRMVVKRKGEDKPKVLSCTLLAYDKYFELGSTLEESPKDVYLKHGFCSQFCVLGGSSCS